MAEEPKVGEQQAAPNAAAPAAPQPAATVQPPQQKTVPITALHEEREKRQGEQAKSQELTAANQAMKDEIEQLKQLINQPMPAFPQQQQQTQFPQQQPVQQPQEDIRAKLDELWESDPRRAMQTEMMLAMHWRDQVEAKVEQQMEQARTTYADFTVYEPVVRRYIRALPLEQRAQENIANAAYYMVRGQKVDDIIKMREQNILEKMRRGEAVGGLGASNAAPGTPQGGPTITDDERKVAAAMGMTVDDYVKNRKAQ